MCKGQTHEFICINCGRVGIPIFRRDGKYKEQFHRKKLYCLYCHTEVNHIEVRNEFEKADILEAFENGEFVEEAKASMLFIENERVMA